MKTSKRKPKPTYDPIKQRAKMVSDELWERAMEIAKVLAPDTPADHEKLPEQMQWAILETVATNLSPYSWDDPEAIRDLYMLRKKFYPQGADPALMEFANRKRRFDRLVPGPEQTPARSDRK